jgi:hypothetical protein
VKNGEDSVCRWNKAKLCLVVDVYRKEIREINRSSRS